MEEINLFFSTCMTLCQLEALQFEEQRMYNSVSCTLRSSLVPNHDEMCWIQTMGSPRGTAVLL